MSERELPLEYVDGFISISSSSRMVTNERKSYLQMEPSDKIRFSGEPTTELRSALKITNKSDTKQAFKVKCTRNDLFRIRPATGILDYNQTVTVHVTFRPSDEPTEEDRHHFGIYHIPAPEGCTCEGAWLEHYGPPQGETRLKVAFEKK